MGNFFTSLFSSSKPAEATEDKAKNEQKNFDILKYDGVRAQKMGKLAYAIKCFTEALNIQEDFETMSYLVSAYTMANDLGKAEDVLNRMVEMEPDHIATRLTRVNLLFMLDKDAEVITDCLHVIELEPSNHVAYFMMAKAKKATNDVFGAIADLTRSIALKEDFADAYLSRAEILLGLGQADEAIETNPSFAKAYSERGRAKNLKGDKTGAFEDLKKSLELNPEGEEAQKMNGQHSNFDNMYKGGIF